MVVGPGNIPEPGWGDAWDSGEGSGTLMDQGLVQSRACEMAVASGDILTLERG